MDIFYGFVLNGSGGHKMHRVAMFDNEINLKSK